MAGRLDDALRFHETGLSLRSQRQQLLASNIANADTPGYKARDIDFSKTLQNAMSTTGTQPSADMRKTNPNHLAPTRPATIGGLEPQYRSTIQGSIDGNTVDMDMERNQFTDNAVRYEAELTIMSQDIKKMLTAIQGQ